MPLPRIPPILIRLLPQRATPSRSSPQASRKKRERRLNPAQIRDAGASVQLYPETSGSSPLLPLKDAAAAPGFWSIAAICATACLGLLIMEFGGSEETYASLFPAPTHGVDLY